MSWPTASTAGARSCASCNQTVCGSVHTSSAPFASPLTVAVAVAHAAAGELGLLRAFEHEDHKGCYAINVTVEDKLAIVGNQCGQLWAETKLKRPRSSPRVTTRGGHVHSTVVFFGSCPSARTCCCEASRMGNRQQLTPMTRLAADMSFLPFVFFYLPTACCVMHCC